MDILVHIDKAKKAIMAADSVVKVKDLWNQADAIRQLGQASKDPDLINHATEFKLRCERRLGELLREKKEAGEITQAHNKRSDTPVTSLSDLGIDKRTSSRSQKIANIPDARFEAVIAKAKEGGRELTRKSFERLTSAKTREAKKTDIPDDLPSKGERYEIHHCDISDAPIADGSLDWIITDPPYPKEFLPVYDKLAVFASIKLKPGGSLICMVGQSYLPEIYNSLSKELTYHWTCCYLTPGGHTQLWARKIMTGWKPLLWFINGKHGNDWAHDVFRSPGDDKTMHHWGQSEGGMADIINQLTYPGEIICDPFCGGGTTGMVAVATDRRFVGIDIDLDAVNTTKARLK